MKNPLAWFQWISSGVGFFVLGWNIAPSRPKIDDTTCHEKTAVLTNYNHAVVNFQCEDHQKVTVQTLNAERVLVVCKCEEANVKP